MNKEEFINWIDSLKKAEPILEEFQNKAKEKLKENGLPHKASEEWRITNLNRFKSIFNLPINNKKQSQNIKINCQEILNLNNLPKGIKILEEHEVYQYYSQSITPEGDENNLLNTLNSAVNTSILGLSINSEDIISLELNISNLEKELNPTKIIIIVEKDSKLNILQIIEGSLLSAHSHLIEIYLKENAIVNHNIIAIGKESSSLLANIEVKQEVKSNYSLISFQEGWYLSRLEKRILQLKGNAKTTIKSLSIAKGNQELATHTVVKFKGPNGSLNQLNKAIIDNNSHYIFNGLIEVPQIAQRTNASQLSKNLLLSSKGRINTTPKLKIIADDVKCNHGATICQLDEDQIFYLKSRGLNKDDSNSLLIKGFCKEITDQLELKNNDCSYLSKYLEKST